MPTFSLQPYVRGEKAEDGNMPFKFAPNACPVLNANAEAPCHFPNPNLALPTISFIKKKEKQEGIPKLITTGFVECDRASVRKFRSRHVSGS
jgi:hypothetical protein